MKSTRALLIIFSLFLIYSCEEDNADVIPDEDPVEKFLGNWKCAEDSEVYGSGYVFDVIITRNPGNSSEILIANFYHQGMNEKARALIAGNNVIIMKQTICDDTIEIEGSGKYSGGEVNLEYTAYDGADLDNVVARLYRP